MLFPASFQNFSSPGKGQERVFPHSPEGQNQVTRHLRKLQTGRALLRTRVLVEGTGLQGGLQGCCSPDGPDT